MSLHVPHGSWGAASSYSRTKENSTYSYHPMTRIEQYYWSNAYRS